MELTSKGATLLSQLGTASIRYPQSHVLSVSITCYQYKRFRNYRDGIAFFSEVLPYLARTRNFIAGFLERVNNNLFSWSRGKDCSGTLPKVIEANTASLLKTKTTRHGLVLIKTDVKRPALTNVHMKT